MNSFDYIDLHLSALETCIDFLKQCKCKVVYFFAKSTEETPVVLINNPTESLEAALDIINTAETPSSLWTERSAFVHGCKVQWYVPLAAAAVAQ